MVSNCMVSHTRLTSCVFLQFISKGPNKKKLINSLEIFYCQFKDCRVVADIVLVIDSSAGVGISKFNDILIFSAELIGKFKARQSDARFGAVVFSRTTEKLFDVQENMTDISLGQVLLNAPFLNEGRRTADALHYVLSTGMFNSTIESGRAAKQFAIVFAGGPADQTELSTLAAAKELKDRNVTIIAVSAADRIDPELPKLASCPTDVFSVHGEDSLTHLERHLIQRTCEGKSS
ncbi:unnamed protein product [Lymnaea stagnalis]|uniref:VWFA domain-containing protein n=1 Tax=Lymnaea stagnalis TaxID=6523 RepID=A0AAV2HA13_LYMST